MKVKDTIRKIKHKTRVRTRVRDAGKKAKTVGYIYRTDGVHGLSAYVKDGVKKRVRKPIPHSQTGDVLFITIDNDMLNHYRVDHMTETLESAGMATDWVRYYDLTTDHIKRYNVFVFYRCPWLPQFEQIFADIRHKNKVSIYAVDDLVIDKKYTDQLPVVQEMNKEDRAVYDDGVNRHGQLMKACDYAITTTGELAKELRTYKNLKEVYVDRNMRSDETIYHSNQAIDQVERDEDKVIIGYFSGTNTHNEDFKMVAPALVRILETYENTYIKLAGRLDAPKELKGYEDRLLFVPLVSWRRLPHEMRNCHINLSPLQDTLFNRAKSELKWADASLVSIPTVASDMGACHDVVKDGETGVLVQNTEDAWFDGIAKLVEDATLRETIGARARTYVTENYNTTGAQAMEMYRFIRRVTPQIVAFYGVNIGAISGGNMVIKKHMDILREEGSVVYGVEDMHYHENDEWLSINREDDKLYDIFRTNSGRKQDQVSLRMSFDRTVATFWSSVDAVDKYQHMFDGSKKLYLVQNMEAGFYKPGDKTRRKVMATYNNHRIQPITISKWCQKWLRDDFGRDAPYAPNGIDIAKFPFSKRDWNDRKIKVLIEGDSSSEYKRVDESFKIANQLDRDKFEVSYLSYNGQPKDWYGADKVYIKVPYAEVSKIYSQNDILIKSSVLESFSYPPLEIMATGGVVVLVKNGGNAEYVNDSENALYYKEGDINDATTKIEKLTKDMQRFQSLAKKGHETALKRDWAKLEQKVIALYA